jgi:hypothetical protein
MTKATATTIALALLTLAGASARAADEPPTFGERHQMVLSAERLFGYVHNSSNDTISLLKDDGADEFTRPRVAFDAFVFGHLTVGAAGGYTHTSTLQQVFTGPAVRTTSWTIALGPRVGYGAALGRKVTLWPRVGFLYLHSEVSVPPIPIGVAAAFQQGGTVYALTIEVPVVVSVAPHFFVHAGPTVDSGLGGRSSFSLDARQTDIGLQAGLGGYF